MWLNGLERGERKGKGSMTDKLVVDASVALKWQFKDELQIEEAIQMLADFIEGKIDLLSPSLFAYEIVNAVHIGVSRKRIPEWEGLEIINDILSVGITLVDFDELVQTTFNLAKTYKRSTYDCAYLALAEKEGCPLYTADERFFNAMKDKVKLIKWVGDYR